jgi:uncharacterized phosphosugar-binding protein
MTTTPATVVDRYLGSVLDAVERVRASQGEAIAAAARACAGSIAADKLAFTFGTGHGSFAALEMFPRTGTPVGFRPIVETPIALFHHVLGDMGAPQYRFLHAQEGYGRAILRAHRLEKGDTMVLFSHSGINPVILDIAVECTGRGMTVVGVTSVPHSSQVPARHSSGRRLYEVADVVIDTGTPLRDAGIQVDGLAHPVDGRAYPVGPTSTVVAGAVAHAIVAGTVQELVARGRQPFVMVNPNTAGREEANRVNDRNYEELWRLLSSR